MDNKEIILASWRLVNQGSILKRFNFFPSFVTTIYLGIIILYQVAFAYIYIFQVHVDIFEQAMNVINSGYIWEIVFLVVFALITYILTIPIAEAGLLALIDRTSRARADTSIPPDPHPYSYGLSRGILFFRSIFELNNLMVSFKIISIITMYLLFIRLIGVQYISTISIVFGCYLFFGFIVNILFAYTRFFIVFDGKAPLEAASASIGMTLDHLAETCSLYFTMLFLYIRTILSAAILIIAPFAVSAILTYVTIDYLRMIGVVILGIIFFAFLIFIAHLNSVLEIFTQSIWYHAFRAFKKEKDDKHDNEDEKEDDKPHHAKVPHKDAPEDDEYEIR